MTTLQGRHCYSHSTDRETEVWQVKVASGAEAELRLKSGGWIRNPASLPTHAMLPSKENESLNQPQGSLPAPLA